ncbi:MAG: type II secretion system protein [Rubrivivax sp.]
MTARRALGFTLLEMLLVVALLAATAGMSLVLLGERDQQARHDETERRLDDALRAVAGDAAPVWGGQVRLSGFVADNGRLPVALRELSDRDGLADAAECAGGGPVAGALLACHKLRAAVFDPTPSAADGFANGSGDEIALTAAGERLPKGLRRYVEGRAGGAAWRDGWGNVGLNAGDDAANFGWQLSLPATAADPWVLTSLGSNNAVDAAPPSPDPEFVADLSRRALADDWSTDIAGWAVRVTNASGAVQPASGARLGVSLLVWRNDAGGGRWKRLSTELDATPLAPGESRELHFAAGGYPGGALSTRVPLGEHLLLLFESADAAAHDADDQPLLVAGRRITTVARFFRGAGRPTVQLTLQ